MCLFVFDPCYVGWNHEMMGLDYCTILYNVPGKVTCMISTWYLYQVQVLTPSTCQGESVLIRNCRGRVTQGTRALIVHQGSKESYFADRNVGWTTGVNTSNKFKLFAGDECIHHLFHETIRVVRTSSGTVVCQILFGSTKQTSWSGITRTCWY